MKFNHLFRFLEPFDLVIGAKSIVAAWQQLVAYPMSAVGREQRRLRRLGLMVQQGREAKG